MLREGSKHTLTNRQVLYRDIVGSMISWLERSVVTLEFHNRSMTNQAFDRSRGGLRLGNGKSIAAASVNLARNVASVGSSKLL